MKERAGSEAGGRQPTPALYKEPARKQRWIILLRVHEKHTVCYWEC